jgi:hypothetical protein
MFEKCPPPLPIMSSLIQSGKSADERVRLAANTIRDFARVDTEAYTETDAADSVIDPFADINAAVDLLAEVAADAGADAGADAEPPPATNENENENAHKNKKATGRDELGIGDVGALADKWAERFPLSLADLGELERKLLATPCASSTAGHCKLPKGDPYYAPIL